MRKVMRGMKVSNSCQIRVGFHPSIFRSVTRLANRAADENLPYSVVAAYLRHGKRIWKNRNFHPIDIQRRWPWLRLLVVRLPDVESVRGSLKDVQYIDTSLGIISHKGRACGGISATLKIKCGRRNDAWHSCTISQAFRDSFARMLILDNQRAVLTGIFRLPQNPHLPYRGRCDEIICKLRRGKPCIWSLSRRSGHG